VSLSSCPRPTQPPRSTLIRFQFPAEAIVLALHRYL
jgi:hypothetical protein